MADFDFDELERELHEAVTTRELYIAFADIAKNIIPSRTAVSSDLFLRAFEQLRVAEPGVWRVTLIDLGRDDTLVGKRFFGFKVTRELFDALMSEAAAELYSARETE